MLTRKNLLITLSAIVLATSSLAMARAVRIRLKRVGDYEGRGAKGRAIINYAKGSQKSILRLHCRGLTPYEQYQVYIGEPYAEDEDPKVKGKDIKKATAKRNGTLKVHAFYPGEDLRNLTIEVWRQFEEEDPDNPDKTVTVTKAVLTQ